MLTFILITIGTAFFTLIFWIYGKGENLLKSLLTVATFAFVFLLIRIILLDKKIIGDLKKLEDKDV